MRPRNDPIEVPVRTALLAAVQTYAEDTGCGDITFEFIDRAAEAIVEHLDADPDIHW